jgi:hypothetical protein
MLAFFYFKTKYGSKSKIEAGQFKAYSGFIYNRNDKGIISVQEATK